MKDIGSLERELAEAKTRIADLQNEVKFLRDLIVIMTPSTKPNTDTPTPSLPPTTSWNSNCPKCGIYLEQVMGYCCPHPRCPTGLGGSHC